jgi:hypothetical protein
MISIFGSRTLSEAKKHSMPAFNMDGDFDEKLNQALDTLGF